MGFFRIRKKKKIQHPQFKTTRIKLKLRSCFAFCVLIQIANSPSSHLCQKVSNAIFFHIMQFPNFHPSHTFWPLLWRWAKSSCGPLWRHAVPREGWLCTRSIAWLALTITRHVLYMEHLGRLMHNFVFNVSTWAGRLCFNYDDAFLHFVMTSLHHSPKDMLTRAVEERLEKHLPVQTCHLQIQFTAHLKQSVILSWRSLNEHSGAAPSKRRTDLKVDIWESVGHNLKGTLCSVYI